MSAAGLPFGCGRAPLFARVALFALIGLILTGTAQGHIGNSTVIHEGFAGNIPVRVIIRPPGVVPGLAEIDVRVLTNGVGKVTVLPVHWRAGLEGAPPPDVCVAVAGEPDLYHAQLWLMSTGAYSVHVDVETNHGNGKVIVPVNSLATTRLPMPAGLTALLIGLGVLLFSLAISVAGAAVRESVLEPGESVSDRRRWIGRATTAVAAVIILTSVWGGKAWWESVDRDYRNNRMFKPIPVSATIQPQSNGAGHVLRLVVDDKKAGNAWGPLVPDHGRLMHLFLMREPALDHLAHLHPVRRSSTTFESALPPTLPPGRYRVAADVTHESGFAQTLVAAVTLESDGTAKDPAGPPSKTLEPDVEDSYWPDPLTAPTVEEGPSPGLGSSMDEEMRPSLLGDGLKLIWEAPSGRLQRGVPLRLSFRVLNAAGEMAPLEAYMGMLSHLILADREGTVFTHLHPAGTISMASQQVFQIRAGDQPPKRITPAMMEALCQPPGPEMLQQPITFPYEFPKSGHYVFWVQVKAGGKVRTARFTAFVE